LLPPTGGIAHAYTWAGPKDHSVYVTLNIADTLEKLKMKSQKEPDKNLSQPNVGPFLRNQLQAISETCINCRFCKQECAFLQEYGKPKQIAETYDPRNKRHQEMAFECSLCELCASVCPVNLNPAQMFLEMRREAVRNGNGNFAAHGGILGYEKRGTSRRFSYYALPEGCDTVFFPGCTLPGTRPETTWSLFEQLKRAIPALGIVLDCCTKPSHDLGRDDDFHAMFHEMRDYLLGNGVRNILVACPNCFKIFHRYGGKLSVETVYEHLAQNGLPSDLRLAGAVTVHDPCGVRSNASIHTAVRNLCERQGLSVEEMPHHGERTLCCGEGGSVGFIMPDFAKRWTALRKSETNGHRIITYCAGCAHFLGGIAPTSHVLDLLFDPVATMAGRVKVSRSPFTYLNRLKLKKRAKGTVDAAITRERTFTVEGTDKKQGRFRRFFKNRSSDRPSKYP